MLGEDAPQFRQQTEDERALITKTVNRLMEETYTEDDLLQPTHLVDMEWIESSVRKWCQEQRHIVLKTGSRAHNCFYKRSSVSAWRLTCMLYHLWGEAEESRQKCIRFYRFMAQYILDGLLGQWGKQYKKTATRGVTPR